MLLFFLSWILSIAFFALLRLVSITSLFAVVFSTALCFRLALLFLLRLIAPHFFVHGVRIQGIYIAHFVFHILLLLLAVIISFFALLTIDAVHVTIHVVHFTCLVFAFRRLWHVVLLLIILLKLLHIFVILERI